MRSEACKYIVDNNDMYNQCKECGSVLAADNGPLGGGGGTEYEPDQKPSVRTSSSYEPLRNVKVILLKKKTVLHRFCYSCIVT